MIRRFLFACCLLALVACDDAKKMIDPTGKAYNTPPDTSAKAKKDASAAKAAANPTPQPASKGYTSPAGMRETMIRPAAHGHDLTPAEAWKLAQDVRYEDARGTLDFHKGVAKRAGEVASLVDATGKPWGISQGDLNLDGDDDVVVLVRLDRRGSPTRWELAYLRNQDGTLFNTQTVPLPGAEGFASVDVVGSGVTLVPLVPGANVHVSYTGGTLSVE